MLRLQRPVGLAEQLAADEHEVGVAAGHSVGEISALAGTNVISAESALVLVRERGRAMAEASAATATGMTAILGGDRDDVLAVIEKHGLTAANDNGPGQAVAAGTMEQLQALADEPPEKARLAPLSVAGAFHTHHMAPAVETLAGYARAISTHDARLTLVSNADGSIVQDGQEVLRRIVAQVSSPVRWDLCMRTLLERGVEQLVELPPAGTLVGLAKRGMKGVPALAVNSAAELEEARSILD